MTKTFHGSCVCGAVRYAVDLDLSKGTTRCNCGFCRKARVWFAFAKKSELRIEQGEDVLTDFQRTVPGKPSFLHFWFCGKCGARCFTEGGELPQFGGAFYAVNLATLDDATDDELATAPVHYADGRNDRWDRDAIETHYL